MVCKCVRDAVPQAHRLQDFRIFFFELFELLLLLGQLLVDGLCEVAVMVMVRVMVMVMVMVIMRMMMTMVVTIDIDDQIVQEQEGGKGGSSCF